VHDREGETRVDSATVDVDGARSALTVVATLLGAGQSKVLSEAVKESSARIESEGVGLPVDLESHGDGPFGMGSFCRVGNRS
jgi:hypothetical protein